MLIHYQIEQGSPLLLCLKLKIGFNVSANYLYFHCHNQSYMYLSGVCFLIICQANFSKKLAFSYLAELSHTFLEKHSNAVGSASRPYTFIEFGTLFCLLTKLANSVSYKFLTLKKQMLEHY